MPSNETEMSRRCYYANIMFIDEQIGQIYNTLKSKNLLENTWIFFTGISPASLLFSLTWLCVLHM